MNAIEQFVGAHGIKQLSGMEQTIALVEAVAHIPWGEGRSIQDVLETKHVGTCTGKHLVLAEAFNVLGIDYRTVVCTFHWSEQQIKLPPELRAILAEGQWAHGHNFLQIRSDEGEWIDIDVTWDPPLAEHGFRAFPEDWNGEESFMGLETLIERHDGVDPSKKQEWIKALDPKTQERRERFLKKLFAWVATLR